MMDENNKQSSSPANDLRSPEDKQFTDILQDKLVDGYRSCFACLKTNRRVVFALLAGQLLSLLLCGTGSTSKALEQFYHIAAPTTQLFFTYLVLALVFGPIVICMTDFGTTFKQNWWKYVIIGIIDVEANYFVVLAYKYTNISSVQILDSFTLFTVLILSYLFLKARYLVIHLMGVSLAVIGIFSLVLVDFKSPHNEAGPVPLLGDLYCLVGAVLYAVSNVAQEYLVKAHSVFEWLGFLGTVGAFVSGIQLSILERGDLASASWSLQASGTFGIFIVCLVLFYILMPIVVRYSNAVVVNLSLLTADVYTIVIGKYLFKQKFMFLYVVSFVIVVFGVFIFNLKPVPIAQPRIQLQELFKLRSRLRRRRQASATPTTQQHKDKITAEGSVLISKDNYSSRSDPVAAGRHRSPEGSSSSGATPVRGGSSIVISSSQSTYGSYSRDGSDILRKVGSRDSVKPPLTHESSHHDIHP